MTAFSPRERLKTFYSNAAVLLRHFYWERGQILLFHRICPAVPKARISANAGLELTPEKFEIIIKFFLSHDYVFLSLDQLEERLRDKRNKGRFVIFTFDDGYADNLHYAFPILKKNNIPFTIYVATCFPEKTGILWWYLLEDIIVANDHLDIQMEKKRHSFPCRTEQEKEDTFFRLRSKIMRDLSRTKFYPSIGEIFSPFHMDPHEKTSELTLSWEQITQLNQDPLVTIGAHSSNHLSLARLSREEVKKEIIDSKEKIGIQIKKEVRHFAYPYGGESEAGTREFNLVRDCGFKTAVTARFGGVNRKHLHYLECLPRIIMTSKLVNLLANWKTELFSFSKTEHDQAYRTDGRLNE
jgi:peptidoglycan/xylan/chitin deacetylase (PgdA/CDA1 family)